MTTTADMTLVGMKMMGALIIGLGGLWGVLYLIRRMTGLGNLTARSAIRVVGTLPIGVRASISMVQIPGAVLVVGVTRNDLRLLDRISDPRLIDELTARGPESDRPKFSDMLRRMRGQGGRKPDPTAMS